MKELISRAAEGDRAALGELYEANRGLIRLIARKYRAACERDRAVDEEDLMQVGFFALASAAQTFDPEAGGWGHWAGYYLHKEMNEALGLRNGRILRPDMGALSLDEPVSAEEADGATRIDLLADESLPESDEALLADEITQEVRAAIGRIPNERQQRVIAGCELDGLTYGDLAEEFGISIETVRCDRRKAFKVLQRDEDLIRLKRAWALGWEPTYYSYKGAGSFRADWTSAVEAAVMRLDERRRRERGPAGPKKP